MLPILYKSSYFTLYAYPLFMGIAWGVGFNLTKYLFQKNNEDQSNLLKLFVGLFLAGWIGAKFFFLQLSAKEKIYQYIYADYFWLGGGFVFYGGLIFGIGFYLLYSLYYKKFNFQKTYLLIPGLAFGHGIGRLGCFLTGCCYGSKCDLPWALKVAGEFRHPVQLYEACALFFLGLLTLKWIKIKSMHQQIVTNYLILYSIMRFFLEFFRGDEIRGIFLTSFSMHLSSAQLISLGIFFGAGFIRYYLIRQTQPS